MTAAMKRDCKSGVAAQMPPRGGTKDGRAATARAGHVGQGVASGLTFWAFGRLGASRGVNVSAEGGKRKSSGAFFLPHEAPTVVSGGPQVPWGGVVGPGRAPGRGFGPRGALAAFGDFRCMRCASAGMREGSEVKNRKISLFIA